ncbi:MAG: signal peptidase I [Myxococcaceae bacterium]|nr:signal peptidase I [Myxococcaceae bacterium]
MDATDYASSGGGGSAIGGLIGLLVELAILVFLIASIWKVFTKAGQPGWACLIPIYNIYVITKIVGRPAWWLVLFIIPFVSLVVAIILYIDLARSFGKGVGFGLGLTFLGFIFMPILGFGSAQYVGPAAASGGAATTA